MKVTMLGRSGVGKTTFMAALGESLLLKNVAGYSIAPAASNLAEKAHRLGRFDEVAFRPPNYQFPEGTNRITLWPFSLYYHQEHVCQFDWMDYRGGALEDIFKQDAEGDQRREEERELVLTRIAESDALLAFADAIALTHDKAPMWREVQSGARIVNLVIRLCAMETRQKYPVVTLLLAKSDSDLIRPMFKENDYQLLRKNGQVAFAETISLCQHYAPYWRYGIVPIGAVGEGRVRTQKAVWPEHFTESIQAEPTISDYPAPFNVAHALFFAVGYALLNLERPTVARIGRLQTQLAEHRKVPSAFDFLVGTRRQRHERIAQIETQLAAERGVLQAIRNHANRLIQLGRQKVSSP